VLLAALAAASAGGAAAQEDSAARVEVLPVQLDAAGRSPELRVPFHVRGDRAIARARAVVAVDPRAPSRPGLEVLVNDRPIGSIPARASGTFAFEVGGSALGDRNALVLRLAGRRADCGLAEAGAWGALRSASLELTTVAVPLPEDLGILPLPFVDPEMDREPEVTIVLPGAGLHAIRAAALVASWLGLIAGVPLRFRTIEGWLPSGHAIVLVDGAAAAARLGLPAPLRPGARMAAGPRSLHARHLVIEAPDPVALVAAAERFARSGRSLAGRAVALDPEPPARTARAREAPRWVGTDRPVRLGDIPGVGSLEHAGLRDGAIEVRFRIPPDLWAWPDEKVRLDLGLAQRLAPGQAPPRLDLHLNGEFLATLPSLRPAPGVGEEAMGRTVIGVPAQRLRGFNALALHVRYPPAEACAASEEPPSVRVTPDSALHLEGRGRFVSLPDLSRMVYDGFPFTRAADLGETLAVLPEPPRADAVAALLSFAAHFASITGRPGTRLAVTTSARLDGAPLERDLLVLGLTAPDPLLSRLRGALPLWVERGSAEVRQPPASSRLLDLLAAGRGRREAARAREALATLPPFGSLQQVASPFAAGRSAVVLFGPEPGQAPSVPDLLGHAESSTPAGDLLVASGERRWMFRIGPSFGSGQLGAVSRARWFLREHWLVLVPVVILGALLVAIPVRAALDAQAEARLHPDGES
jgi:cellulose synthase (UDP-forming)